MFQRSQTEPTWVGYQPPEFWIKQDKRRFYAQDVYALNSTGGTCKFTFCGDYGLERLVTCAPATLRTLIRCVCDPRPSVFLHRRWIENGVCAFKAPDCLSLCAAERLTPSGHSGHLSGGRTPSWRSSKRKQPQSPRKEKTSELVAVSLDSLCLYYSAVFALDRVAACE